MAPRDQPDALGGVIRRLAQFGDRVRRDEHRLEHHLDRDGRGDIQRLRNFLRMLRHGLEGFRSVQMLAAGDKPDFKLLQVDVHNGLQ